MAKKKPFIIDDSTSNDVLYPKGFGRGFDREQRETHDGYIPKASITERPADDFRGAKIVFPQPMGAPPEEVDIIPESEWDARFDEQEKYKSSLSHIRMRGNNGKMIPSLDQNGQGYCWMYSGVGCIMLSRAVQNQPYVRLSAHAGAWVIKKGRDEGGWTGLAGPFIEERGVPDVDHWPEKSMNGRQYDTPATWENAKLYRPTETWIDMRASMYDRTLSRLVLATLLFNNIPCTGDFDWWAHSVPLLRWVRIERGSWGLENWNSWTDGWGNSGTGILQGSRAIHSGACAFRTPIAMAA